MGVAHEANIAAVAIIVLPYRAFLISQLTWSNPGQTRIIFKPGLTRTKHDPGDPTRFQRWSTPADILVDILILVIQLIASGLN